MNRQIKSSRAAKHHRLARFAVAFAAIGAGYGGLAGTAAPAGAASNVSVKLVSHSGLGKILVNSSGMAVYILTSDSPNKPTCTGGCATVWPPVIVAKGTKPKAGPGVKGLGTVPVAGELQLTWNKHPLYTYALDSSPGVVNGNGVKMGSGTWFAATSKVAAAKAAAASTGGSTGGSSGGYGY